MSLEEKEKAKRDLMDNVRYDLVSPYMIESLARTFAEGSIKYGDENWRKGLLFSNLLNHAMNHLVKYMMGDKIEPHLDHAFWNIGAMIEFRETGREAELNDLYFHNKNIKCNDTPLKDEWESYLSLIESSFFDEQRNYFNHTGLFWCIANYTHDIPDHSKCNHSPNHEEN